MTPFPNHDAGMGSPNARSRPTRNVRAADLHQLRRRQGGRSRERVAEVDLAVVPPARRRQESAALLHDAAGADPREDRAQHENASADFARETLANEGWSQDRIEAVVECVLSHRYRGKQRPESLEARILFDADKLDVVGAFGVARTIGYAIQAGEPIFAKPSEKFLASGELEPGEPHSAYHEYLFKLRNVKDRLHTDPARRLAAEREKVLVSFFEQLAAEARGDG